MKRATKTTTLEAVLGVLSMGPMTGYEIRQRIELSIGNFWSESFGQIYPALTKLGKQGLVRWKESGKAGRRVYSLTPAGRERLRDWLKVMPMSQPLRNERLLKLFFSYNGDLKDTREQVLDMRAKYLKDLHRYLLFEPELIKMRLGSPGLPFFLMTLRYGVAEARAVVEWADETLHEIDRIEREKAIERAS